MKKILSAAVFCAAAFMSGRGLGAGPPAAEPGEYEVSVRLELPHLEDMATTKLARICVTGGEGGTHGLAVLGGNNPLARCPASNIHEDGGVLTFDIVCPGGNAATGSAKYTLRAQGFDGAIAMKMGGKNMTMTERQLGRRIGSCDPVKLAPS
jgi:hypothetical protein